jgi:hypothetical protein
MRVDWNLLYEISVVRMLSSNQECDSFKGYRTFTDHVQNKHSMIIFKPLQEKGNIPITLAAPNKTFHDALNEKCVELTRASTKSCPAHPFYDTLVLVYLGEEMELHYYCYKKCCIAFEAEIALLIETRLPRSLRQL